MYRTSIIPAVFCLLFFYTASAQSGDLVFKHLTKSAGLPVETITALAQDSSGFIWIGSNEGLFRYDGFNFKEYHHDLRNPNSIPSNAITKIYVTRKGLLWIATVRGGIACIDRNGKVIRIINSYNTPSFTKESDFVNNIKEDEYGNIWCSTTNGFFRILAKDGEVSRFKLASSLARDNSFADFAFDASGKIWLSSLERGVLLFDPAAKSFVQINHSPYNFKIFENKNYFHALALHKGKLWYSTWWPDIGVYDTATKKDAVLFSKSGLVVTGYNRMAHTFYIDSKKNIWAGTGNGLFFSSNSSSFEKAFFNEVGNNHSIINNWITSILEDREGNFWFGTKEGISIAQPYKEQVTNLSVHNQKKFLFGNKEVSNIIEADSNTLLIGTTMADGIYETDLDFKLKKHFSFRTAAYDWIWTYYHDKPRHRIFISTQEGMLLYNTQTHTLKKLLARLDYNINTISSFVATSDSIVWMSRFRNSFLKYSLKTDTYKEYQLEDLGEKKQILTLSKDKNNKLWLLANSTGVFRFDERSEKIVQRLTSDTTTNALLQTQIWFFKDLGDYYLIGYQTKGISLYNKKDKTYRHFTLADGLASNNTKAAFVTDDDKAWIATGNGISLFDPATKTFKNYDYEAGIIHNNIICITQLSDGRMAAGTDYGLVVFNPKTLNSSTTPLPPPLITDISLHGQKLSVDSLLLQKLPLEVSYKENYFAFDFISPLYNNNQQIQYAYKLEGIDKDWIESGTRRFASYSNIKGGKYFFKLKSRLPGGSWVENKVYLPVWVSTAFYTQWWFYLLCALFISIVLYVIFRYRLQQVVKMERMRSSISGDLHDEVGASLTSISIFSEMAKSSVSPLSKEAEYLQRIGERSRESIEKMGDIIWSINPDNDNLQQQLVRMKNYATEITEAKDIAIVWNETGNLDTTSLNMEQRKNFYLLFKEVINNSIKHAAAKNISIALTSAGDTISLRINDDGKGFDTSSAASGNGLKSMRRNG